METETIYVVDEQGATFWFRDKSAAEARLVSEAWLGAVHLSIAQVEVPIGMTNEQLGGWACGNAADCGCDN
jgi:hypothetical protein